MCRTLASPFAILLHTTDCVLRVIPLFNKRVIPISPLNHSHCERYRCGSHCVHKEREVPPRCCHCRQSSLSALWYRFRIVILSTRRFCSHGKTEGRSRQEGYQRHRASHILSPSVLFSSRYVQERNQEAIDFYKGCGFVTKEHIDNYYKRLHCSAAYKMVCTI